MEPPTRFRILSSAANAELAPSDTLVRHETKTVEQALGLLRQGIDRTATTWEPILRATPEPISSSTGQGFFTEAGNQSGEWQKQKGYFSPGSFSLGSLWPLYSSTHDDNYRK